MATYVCSDIHGMLNSYKRLLQKLNLKKNDTLYILGDVIDRKEYGLEIIDDIMHHDNVKLLLGNHELFLLDTFGNGKFDEDAAWKWIQPNNGGYVTMEKFRQLNTEEQNKILSFLHSCLVIKRLTVNGTAFHLSHASTLQNLQSNEVYYKDLAYNDLYQVVWCHVLRHKSTQDSYDRYDPRYTYVSGHVPVQKTGAEGFTYLQNIIDIDCGCSYDYESRALCCLCLDTMQPLYIR